MVDAGWKRSIDEGLRDSSAHVWDGVVRTEVGDYNSRLAATPGYVPVDPKLILAMLWVESGGPGGSAWWGRVMQIGNPGDRGYQALEDRDGATSLIVPADLLSVLDAGKKALDSPQSNVRAGVAYLFVRMAMSEPASLPDPTDTAAREHRVAAGENASEIAAGEGSTIDDIRASNPGVDVGRLHVGQVLRFHKAHMGRRITGWRVFDAATVAARYNVGDPGYADKLRYVMVRLNKE